MKTYYLLLLAVPFLLANSCMETNPSFELSGSSWQLEYLFGNALPSDLAQGNPTLIFGDSMTVSGRGICNSFNGPVHWEQEVLKIGPLARTKMFCPHMEIEDQFMYALQNIDSYQLNSGKLELIGEEEVVAVFRKGS